MATIPIEVIVQDKEIPVPETNTEETTAGTPDTGVGLVDNNTTTNGMNGVFSSSANTIILPAILLTLTLITLVVLFIRKHLRHNCISTKTSRKEKLVTITASTIAILAATVLVGNLLIPATKATADNTSNTEDGITFGEDIISITVTRDGDSAEANVESIATITSNADFGYKVLLSMAEGVDATNLYLEGNEDSEYYIASTEDTKLTNNTWGFALTEDDEYSAMPLLANATIITQGSEAVEDEELTVYYGVKVSSDLPEGTYSGEIEYTLDAIEPTIGALTYMQDFATLSAENKALILNSMTEGEQYQLKDSRDEKQYFISKLADGNVWMTQNLGHDIGDIAGGTYTSVDTDIPADWTPTDDELTKQVNDTSWDGGANHTPQSYNPGDLYWDGDLIYNQETCIEHGGTWSSNFGGSCSGYNTISSTGNEHYRLGNYYNWTAAIAMSDSSGYTANNTDVNQSICPAGWMLPKGGTILTGPGSFIYLKDSANLTSGADGNIHTDPNYFAYSGDLNGRIGGVGSIASYLSSVVSDGGSSYGLNFDSYSHFNLPGLGRNSGHLIRCVAR